MDESEIKEEKKDDKRIIVIAEGMSSDLFHRPAVEEISTPEELNLLFWPVKEKTLIGWIALGSLLLLALLWLIFGNLPITVTGLGIVMSEKGLFTIQAPHPSTVESILVSPGQIVSQGQTVILLTDKELVANHPGTVLEILTKPGSKVTLGDHLLRLEPYTEGENAHLIYAFIPTERGKEIQKGMEMEIELSTLKATEFGALIGRVTDISTYPVSRAYVENILHNKGVVDYFLQGKEGMILLTLKPVADPQTPSGYRWTSTPGPNIQLTTGTIVRVKAIVSYSTPLDLLLPHLRSS